MCADVMGHFEFRYVNWTYISRNSEENCCNLETSSPVSGYYDNSSFERDVKRPAGSANAQSDKNKKSGENGEVWNRPHSADDVEHTHLYSTTENPYGGTTRSRSTLSESDQDHSFRDRYTSYIPRSRKAEVNECLENDTSEDAGQMKQFCSNSIDTELRVLEREEKYLSDMFRCVLCHFHTAEVTFLPCGHFVACSKCSEPCRICPKCDREILAEAKTYLS